MPLINQLLQKYWGYSSFRLMQEKIINSALDMSDTLVLMPTGGGKSICFQLPALAKDGICIVVSPLIALIKDQVQNLNDRGIKALAIYSGMSFSQIDTVLDNAIYGNYKFLYVSAERLLNPIFKERVKRMNVNYLVVDEAHCISQWGYDFRPAYLQIKEIKKLLINVPIIALTATATKQVALDIMSNLEFKTNNIIASGFARENLSYVVRKTDDKYGNLLRICNGVTGSGIVYIRERKKCEDISNFLQQNGVSSDFYHAGLSKDMRSLKQDKWMKNDIRVIVATSAFGMGIDKPDVRFVAHYDLPDAIEAYFQEAGRAGRDGKRSYTTLLWNNTDIKRLRQIHTVNFPSIDYLKDIYQKVFIYLNYPYEHGNGSVNKFNLVEFSKKFALNATSVYYAIKYIEQEGYWELTDEIDNPSKIIFIVNRDELYKVQIDNYNLDAFIKSLLRIYTGLFSKVTAIDEDYIARVTLDSTEGVKNKLITLSKMKIIKYIPKLRTPLMIMNFERLTESNFYISEQRYVDRKDLFKKRIEGMIEFITNNSMCRSRQLIKYFGQEDIDDCGICDVCLELKNISDGNSLKEEVAKKIISFVSDRMSDGKKTSLQDIKLLAQDNVDLYLNITRELIDKDLLNKDIMSNF